jgi:hypothetical protein
MTWGFSIENGFRIGKLDSTLFTRKIGKDLLICQTYVDDIIFGSTNALFCEEFSKIMIDRFEMSMMGELKYFLGFQIKQLEDGTFISQTKYALDLLKKLVWTKPSPSRLSWVQMVILILTWAVSLLIKRYIAS